MLRGGKEDLARAEQKVAAAFADELCSGRDEEEWTNETETSAEDGAGGTDSDKLNTLTKTNAEKQLTVFHSAAAGYFHGRDYKGLERQIPQGQTTAVQKGQFGVAAGYVTLSEVDA